MLSFYQSTLRFLQQQQQQQQQQQSHGLSLFKGRKRGIKSPHKTTNFFYQRSVLAAQRSRA